MINGPGKIGQTDPGDFRGRFKIVILVVMVTFMILVGRLWYLQVIKGKVLRNRSENNRIRVREIKPLRGLILDRNGRILVDNQASFDISIIPEETKDMGRVLEALADLKGDRNVSYYKDIVTSEMSRPFVPITLERNVSRHHLAVVETHSLSLPGIVSDVVPVRRYNYGETMAHLMGYVGEVSAGELGKDTFTACGPGDIVGKYGIEKYFDGFLRGESGGKQVEVDVSGRQLEVLGRIEPVPGYHVQLTIDADLQSVCWDAFDKKAGSAIVMNPRDGSILAMVSKPSFDPNLFNRGISRDEWRRLSLNTLCPMQNRAVAGQYPPGSTFKLIVAAAGLEEGIITDDMTVTCNGSYRVGNRTFRCWKRRGHGAVDLHHAIVQSCDVFFYSVGEQLGVDTIARYARGFGFGSLTGIAMPGEKKGLVPTRDWKEDVLNEPWQRGETISVSIGQGFLLVTPLQLLSAYCAIANGGTLYRPRLVESINVTQKARIKLYQPEVEAHLPVTPEHLKLLRKALWGVVNEPHGTGWALRQVKKDVCGKTGTAQVISMPEDEKEEDEIPYQFRDHALFVCFAPLDNPEIAVAVVVEHGGHGGSAAAPIARTVVEWYFNRDEKGNTVTRLASREF